MTAPKPPPNGEKSTVDATATTALQDALATEHAALWCYALAIAFLPKDQVQPARTDIEAHRALRVAVEQTLTQVGAKPVSAQPAYATPQPVVDGPSAAALVVVAETDSLAAWRSVLERTTDKGLRKAALRALSEGTLRCARWRKVTNTNPTIPTFPGRPEAPA
jgi:hypothetical protein